MCLIDEVGVDYFNDMCRDALLLKDDEVYRVLAAGRGGTVDVIRYSPDGEQTRQSIEKEFFTGWKVFSHPILGYRRFGDQLIGHAQRRQSTRRGLRPESINITLSPCSTLLANMNAYPVPSANDKAVAAMKPQFDDFDRDLPRMLSGELMGLVLSDNIIIEPDVAGAKATGYSVFMRQHVIGKMDAKGAVTWENEGLSNTLDLIKRGTTNG